MSLEELDRFEVTAVRIYRALEELQLDNRPLKEALETVFQPAIALRAIETSPEMQARLEAHTAVERSLKQVEEVRARHAQVLEAVDSHRTQTQAMMDRLGVFYDEIESLKTRLAKLEDEATTLLYKPIFPRLRT